MLGKNFDKRHTESYFSQETGFDISYKLSPMETICMKFLILFSEEKQKEKNVTNASFAEFANRVLLVYCNLLNFVINPFMPHWLTYLNVLTWLFSVAGMSGQLFYCYHV